MFRFDSNWQRQFYFSFGSVDVPVTRCRDTVHHLAESSWFCGDYEFIWNPESLDSEPIIKCSGRKLLCIIYRRWYKPRAACAHTETHTRSEKLDVDSNLGRGYISLVDWTWTTEILSIDKLWINFVEWTRKKRGNVSGAHLPKAFIWIFCRHVFSCAARAVCEFSVRCSPFANIWMNSNAYQMRLGNYLRRRCVDI